MSSQVIFYVEAWLQCKVTIKYISAKKEKVRKKKEARKGSKKRKQENRENESLFLGFLKEDLFYFFL